MRTGSPAAGALPPPALDAGRPHRGDVEHAVPAACVKESRDPHDQQKHDDHEPGSAAAGRGVGRVEPQRFQVSLQITRHDEHPRLLFRTQPERELFDWRSASLGITVPVDDGRRWGDRARSVNG